MNDILQDKRGYLWIATAGGGISKFDGSTFIEYSKKDGLTGNIITGLTKDSDHNIWLASAWGELTKYDGNNFLSLSKKDIPSNKYSHNTIFADSQDRIWIGTKNGLIVHQDGKFKTFTKENNEITNNFINKITEDSKGNIWVSTRDGISVFTKEKTVFLTKNEGLPLSSISAIEEDAEGNILIGHDKGIIKFLVHSFNKRREFEFVDVFSNKINASITDIVKDKKNKIWVTTKENGLFILEPNGTCKHLTKTNGLTSNYLTKLFIDNSGNLWIGTNGTGLMKYGPKAFVHFDKIKGLNNPKIYTICSDKENNIWFGTHGDGLYKYDGKVTTQYTVKDGLRSNIFSSSVIDKKGNLWFGTKNGLTRYAKGKFKNFTVADGLPSNLIKSLLLDNTGNLWIGTYGKGLSKYDFNSFTNFTKKDGLPNNNIHSLFEDSKGNIWIGTDQGATKYAKQKFTNYGNTQGFCDLFIGCITEDKLGNIWFGTDRCAVKYNGKNFKSITTDDGLSSNIIYLIYTDSQGDLWIGTNNGIDKIDFDKNGGINKIKNYKSKQGFKGNECNSGAICEDSELNLWVGTVKGLVKFNPKNDNRNIAAPKIYISNLKLFFEDVNWLNYCKKLTKWDKLPIDLVLEHNQNHLTFEFSTINFNFPENINYRFKLTPFDNKWFYPSEKNNATYSNLSPGSYTFNVSAKNEYGTWSESPATYSFTISPPWWKKWWAILILTLLVFYAIFQISSFKEKRQQKVSQELEKKVRQRTILIESQRDEKEIMLKEIHHRVKNNMQVIISLLSIQSGFTKDQAALVLFDEAKNRIRSMALIHEKMYQSGDLAHIDFQDYILALINDIKNSYSINSGVSLDVNIEKVKFDIDMLIPLGLLLNEIISNALKYAFNDIDRGKIIVKLNYNKEEGTYKLLIGDNGCGMEKGTLQKEEGTLGIELIKVFVDQLDGTISRQEGEGTFYEIIFGPRQ